jgi:hypothetical protein
MCSLQQIYTEGKLRDFFMDLNFFVMRIENTKHQLIEPFRQMFDSLQALAPLYFYAHTRAAGAASHDKFLPNAVYHPRMVTEQLSVACLMLERILAQLREAVRKLEDN